MFENLTDRLSDAFRKLTGRGVLTESDVKQAMRQVRRALLEADVNFKVARKFVSDVSCKATGENVLKSLAPGKQVIKIVNDEIIELLGTGRSPLQLSGIQGRKLPLWMSSISREITSSLLNYPA